MGAAGGGHQWRISRYTRNGELDRGFGAGRSVTTSLWSVGGLDEHIWNLTLDARGRIVAAGDAVTEAGGFDVALARYHADGTLDTSFGAAGKVTTAVGPGSRRDRAHAPAREEVELARAWGAPGTLGRSLRILGLVEGAQPDRCP